MIIRVILKQVGVRGEGELRRMRGCVVLGDGCVECGWVWSVECGVGSTQG